MRYRVAAADAHNVEVTRVVVSVPHRTAILSKPKTLILAWIVTPCKLAVGYIKF